MARFADQDKSVVALRQKAEAKLRARGSPRLPPTEADAQRLLHELQVHQIELEMQNEALQEALAKADAGQHFSDLFEFAPTAYFGIGRDSSILLFNQAGANLIRLHGKPLKGQRLSAYIEAGSLPAFNHFLDRAFAGEGIQICETRLQVSGNVAIDVRIDAVADRSRQVCKLSIADISNIRQYEDQLRESQRDLKRAQFLAHIGSWRLALKSGEITWSDEVYRIFEIPSGTPQTLESFMARVHPDDRRYVREKWAAALQGAPYDIDHRIIVGDKLKWVRERASLEFDAQGRLIGGFGAIQEITERKLLENEIRRRDQYQRALLDNIPCLAWLKDEESRFLAVNGPFAACFGYPSHDSLIGKNDYDIVSPALAEAYRADDRKVMEIGLSHRVEEIIETGGERRWFETYKSPVQVDGRIAGTAGFSFDITDRRCADQRLRESEEKFREQSRHLCEVIWGTNSGTWEWNLKSGELVCNERWAEMIGYSLEELLPTNIELWRRFVHPDDQKIADENLQRLLNHETQVFECEVRLQHRSGEWVWVVCRGRVVEETPDGQPLRMSGTNQNIDSRKRVEAALLVAKAEAERANHAKSHFLASASHDLRQPLAALGLYVGVMKSRLGPSEGPLLKSMASCVASLNELLTDLLDISKLEAGVVLPEICDFPMADLLASLVAMHAPEAQLKGLRLRWVPSGLNTRTDPVLLKRMVGNLVANAIRYTEHGGVLIACRRHHGKHWIEVWDTGIGIPEDKTSEIFEEFRQLDHNERNRGSGLGLAIVAKSAVLLGLQVRVRSRPGKGSMFAIELPPGKKRRVAAPRKGAQRALRVALVDDNPNVLHALTYALEALGHEVVPATTGKKLLARLGSERPDIVISDYRLGHGQTGYDVVDSVQKSFNAKLPALIITGDTDPRIIRTMADQGITVLHKPLEIEDLKASLLALTGAVKKAGKKAETSAPDKIDHGGR